MTRAHARPGCRSTTHALTAQGSAARGAFRPHPRGPPARGPPEDGDPSAARGAGARQLPRQPRPRREATAAAAGVRDRAPAPPHPSKDGARRMRSAAATPLETTCAWQSIRRPLAPPLPVTLRTGAAAYAAPRLGQDACGLRGGGGHPAKPQLPACGMHRPASRPAPAAVDIGRAGAGRLHKAPLPRRMRPRCLPSLCTGAGTRHLIRKKGAPAPRTLFQECGSAPRASS